MAARTVLAKLRVLKPILKERYGIESFAIFGSVAGGVSTKSSDIDIAILEMNPKSGFDLIRAKNFLQNELNMQVDIGALSAMKHFVRKRVEKDLIYV